MKDWEKKVRSWAWERLVFLADRISPEDAFRYTGYSMSLRKGRGWVFEEHEGENGVPLWYKGEREYLAHSHDGYDAEPETRQVINISEGLTEESVRAAAQKSLWWELSKR